MRLLLHTVTFSWLVDGTQRLVASALDQIREPGNDVFLNAASVCEIAIKHGLGRLHLRVPPDEYVVRQRALHRIEPLPITEQAALQVAELPTPHRDPFDRVIVA